MSVGVPTQVNPQNEPTPGSLTGLMDALEQVQAAVATHPALTAYGYSLNLHRWRPDAADPPLLYNWLLTSGSERKDLSRVRDTLPISTRIGISFTEVGDRMRFVEAAADAYRAIVDAAFWDGMRMPRNAIGSAATWAMRSSMQSFTDTIGETPVVGIEFVQAFWLDHAA